MAYIVMILSVWSRVIFL